MASWASFASLFRLGNFLKISRFPAAASWVVRHGLSARARARVARTRRVGLGPPAAGRPRHTAKPARPTSLHFTRACVRSREWAPRRYSCRVACVAVAPTPSPRRDAPAHEHHWQGGGVERGAAHWVRARERARGAAPCRPCCASSLGPRGCACARTELEERWTSRKSTVGCARCSRS